MHIYICICVCVITIIIEEIMNLRSGWRRVERGRESGENNVNTGTKLSKLKEKIVLVVYYTG